MQKNFFTNAKKFVKKYARFHGFAGLKKWNKN